MRTIRRAESTTASVGPHPLGVARLVALSLLLTVLMGGGLRWALAGWSLPWGTFERWRHAHSHLGYFAVLFPLMWAAWVGGGSPGPWLGRIYGVGAGLATVGFIRAGYGPEAIVGSTVVGTLWLISAVARICSGRGRGWSAPAPWAILLACCCIPPIALFTRRDPVFAAHIVRTFLGLLLLGAFVPTALGALGLRAPRPWMWLAAAALGAAFLGVAPHPLLGLGLLALGGMLLWSLAGGGALPRDVAGLWGALAVGLAAMGSSLLPNVHQVAIAAVHFAILGPLLMTAAVALLPRPTPLPLRILYEGLLLGMVGAIAAMAVSPVMFLARAAAAFGSALAVVLLGGIVLALRGLRGPPPPQPGAPSGREVRSQGV